jgi:hypothetical protein
MERSRTPRAFREQVHSDSDDDDDTFYAKITLHITPISTFHFLALLIITFLLQMSVASVTLSPLKYGVAMASQTDPAFVKSNFTLYVQYVRATVQATKFIWQ